MMFKVLVLQTLYALSDDQAEFQIKDRLSFMRFLGLGLEDRVPDAKTIWLFREQLTRAGAIERLFARFDRDCAKPAISRWAGRSSMPPSWQRRASATREGEGDIKEGNVPEDWSETPPSLPRWTRTRRWTLKRESQVAEEGRRSSARSPSRCSATRTIRHRSPARLHPQLGHRARRPTTAPAPRSCSTATTRRRRSGPTPPIVRRRTKRGWSGTATSPTSIRKSRRANR